MKNVKKIIYSFIFLLMGFACIFFAPVDKVNADTLEVYFNYSVEDLDEALPSQIRNKYINILSANVEPRSTVKPPIQDNMIGSYYNLSWQVIENGSLKDIDINSYPITKSVTFKAKWTPVNYYIYYMYESGVRDEIENIIEYETYNFESKQINFYKPRRPNYIFDNWYEDKDFSKLCINRPEHSIGNQFVYAKWIPIKYKINYHTDVDNSDNIYSFVYGDVDFELQAPTKEGYIFQGWFLDEKLTKECRRITSDMSGDIDLYPKWEPIQLKVTYVLPDGSHKIVYCDYGSTVSLPDIEKGFFEIFKTNVSRDNITKDKTILLSKVNIWYVYFIGLMVIITIISIILIVHFNRMKKLKRLRVMYQSNYKKY